jgi:hypothetical protein
MRGLTLYHEALDSRGDYEALLNHHWGCCLATVLASKNFIIIVIIIVILAVWLGILRSGAAVFLVCLFTHSG